MMNLEDTKIKLKLIKIKSVNLSDIDADGVNGFRIIKDA